MKKLLSLVLCVMILAATAVPVMAASNTSFSMSVSDSTPKKGSTVTFTVTVASSEPATSYGLQLSYDSTALELISGSCTVSGTMVSSFNNGFAFMFQTPTAYSGTVGTVTFKVKDNASFGNYTVSGTASVKNGNATVEANGASATITVSCSHSYGGWTKVNDTNHKRTCSLCQNAETANHSWNSGTVTKRPTCKETGTKTFACTTCNASKTESVAKTSNHQYSSWTKVNDTTHKHTCSVCSKEETANHSWDSGKVTKQPTCKEEGVKTYTCSGCKGTKTEPVAKTTAHNYGSWTKVNDTTHKRTCTACSKEETANHTWNSGSVTRKATCKESGVKTFTCTGCNATKAEVIAKLTTHTYDHACDTTCNACGTNRTASHNYKTTWSKDRNNHWHECSVCKDKKDVAAHTPGAEATETKAQTCTTCGYVIKAALGHKHNYAITWTTDDAGHWYACSGCEEKSGYAAHDFENACDKDCSVCGYTRQTAHRFAESWSNDENNHWNVCTGCGLKQDSAAHEPGAAATATNAQTCTVCSYELAPKLSVAEKIEEMNEETECTEPSAEDVKSVEQSTKKEFPLWIVIVAAVAVLGIAVVLFVKKKR